MKMTNLVVTLATVTIAVAISPGSGLPSITAHAQVTKLPAACMKSFDVKDKAFSSGNATMSCRLTEIRRGELFAAIDGLEDAGEIDGNDLSKRLSAIEATLKKQEDEKNWVGIGGAVTGNALATIGLSACFAGPAGCGLAVVGKVLALVGVVDAAQSEAEKSKAASQLRADLAKLRASVAGKKTKTKAVRDRLIVDFARLCDDVKKYCL
jgi:hypothetical protein